MGYYYDQVVSKALTQVNRGRRALFMKSLRRFERGIPRSCSECPVKKALSGEVLGVRAISGGWAYVDTEDEATLLAYAWAVGELAPDGQGGWAAMLPDAIKNFIEYFDKGKLPLLEIIGPKNHGYNGCAVGTVQTDPIEP